MLIASSAGAATYAGHVRANIASPPNSIGCTYQMGISPQGALHVADPCSGQVWRVSDGALVKTRDHYDCPIGVAYDTAGNEFTTDGCSGRLYEYAAGSSTAVILSRSVATGGSDSILVKWGHIFLAENHGGKVVEFNKDGTNETTLLSSGVGSVAAGFKPTGIAAVGNKLVVDDSNDALIYVCNHTCSTVTTIPGKADAEAPQSLAEGQGGKLLQAIGNTIWQRSAGTWTPLVTLPENRVIDSVTADGHHLVYESSNCGSSKIKQSLLDGTETSTVYTSVAVGLAC